jgi:hypothetical protein
MVLRLPPGPTSVVGDAGWWAMHHSLASRRDLNSWLDVVTDDTQNRNLYPRITATGWAPDEMLELVLAHSAAEDGPARITRSNSRRPVAQG